jgi:transcriptional regulator with GAF, ATPase, and Fis domain
VVIAGDGACLPDLVGQVASSRSTILITGETGTGKELIAKAIHTNSPRSERLFVPVNSGSLPADLLESTLFGHVKGAFTSAIHTKKGYFEVADRGTKEPMAPGQTRRIWLKKMIR